jgi:hypothetical protein
VNRNEFGYYLLLLWLIEIASGIQCHNIRHHTNTHRHNTGCANMLEELSALACNLVEDIPIYYFQNGGKHQIYALVSM